MCMERRRFSQKWFPSGKLLLLSLTKCHGVPCSLPSRITTKVLKNYKTFSSRPRPRPNVQDQDQDFMIQDQDQDFHFCPRGASRPRPWSRGLHHCLVLAGLPAGQMPRLQTVLARLVLGLPGRAPVSATTSTTHSPGWPTRSVSRTSYVCWQFSRSADGLFVALMHVAHLSHWTFTSWSSGTAIFWHLSPSCLDSVAGPLAELRPHSDWFQTTCEKCIVLTDRFWFGRCARLCDSLR